ncbi:MAG TPA: hypothetical protein DCO83_17870 [Mucilaginibacter sp.]|nr:hypothetical protein [Mucilaginibacter sp.]
MVKNYRQAPAFIFTLLTKHKHQRCLFLYRLLDVYKIQLLQKDTFNGKPGFIILSLFPHKVIGALHQATNFLILPKFI